GIWFLIFLYERILNFKSLVQKCDLINAGFPRLSLHLAEREYEGKGRKIGRCISNDSKTSYRAGKLVGNILKKKWIMLQKLNRIASEGLFVIVFQSLVQNGLLLEIRILSIFMESKSLEEERIHMILYKKEDGTWIFKLKELEDLVTNFYKDLFMDEGMYEPFCLKRAFPIIFFAYGSLCHVKAQPYSSIF
ncbi:hypothetical protein CR513_21832, partial [Mucuna pruriens]